MSGPARPRRLAIACYLLAQLGGFLAFIPVLTLLLPRRALAIDPVHAPRLLSAALLAGALCASLANIAAGRLGDWWLARHGNRRAPLALGAAGTALALPAMALAHSAAALIGAVVGLQAVLNLLLAPLAAMLPDHVPDRAKGAVAAGLNLALPLAGLGTAAVAHWLPHDGTAGFVVAGAAVALACAPLVVLWPFAPHTLALPEAASPAPPALRVQLAPLAAARFLVQACAAFVFQYVYLYLAAGTAANMGLDPAALVARSTLAATAATVLALPLLGHWSDRVGQRRPLMIIAAAILASAAGALGLGTGAMVLGLAYALFQLILSAYLAIETALVGEIVQHHSGRGQVLGLMNLANTAPSVAVPALIGMVGVGPGGLPWPAAFLGAAALALAGGACVAVRRAAATGLS
jgi:MFS family permease